MSVGIAIAGWIFAIFCAKSNGMTTTQSSFLPLVVITRPERQAAHLVELLAARGISNILLPATRIETLAKSPELTHVLNKLAAGEYAWVVFTSVNGVECLSEMMREHSMPEDLPEAVGVACQGVSTAECARRLFKRCDLVPARSVLEALGEALHARCKAGNEVLVPGAEVSRDVLEAVLGQHGIGVKKLPLYRTVEVEADPRVISELHSKYPEEIIFTFFSPSAFHATLHLLPDEGKLLRRARIVTVGPVTTQAVQDKGFAVAAESEEQSDEGVVRVLEDLVAHLRPQR